MTSFLTETLGAWRHVRHGAIDEIENIAEEHFDFRPAPEVRSIRELTRHILEVAAMMTGELAREDTDFRRAPWPELLSMYGGRVAEADTREALLVLMGSQLEEAAEAFEAVGEAHMMETITNFDGSTWTRMQWLHHGISHEMYHRGQMTLYARMLGLVPALTRRIEAGEE
jgi:uncharacterized damage-inducible protein DinB